MKLAVLLVLASSLLAQQAFDVASVKQSPPPVGDSYTINLGNAHHGEVTLSNATLADCVKFAYGLVSDSQLAGPEWIFSKAVHFDVIAKAPAATPRDQLLLMLRTLLGERFGLETHIEQKRLSHYVLIPGKDGPKVHEVPPATGPGPTSHGPGRIDQPAMLMHSLALMLSRQTGEPVLDQTGLKGWYQVKLNWTPEGSDLDQGPSIFTAVQEQLGLKLELSKEPVAVLVIDHAERVPVAN